MLKLAKLLHYHLWKLLAWLLILLAVLLTILRLALPYVDLERFRGDFELMAREAIGLPLKIGLVQAELRGFRLNLKLSDIDLYDPQTDNLKLHIPQIQARIHLLRSLLQGSPVLGKGVLIGADLAVTRAPDGGISINGYRLSGGESADGGVGKLLSHSELRLHDSYVLWDDQLSGQAPIRLSQVDMLLLNRGDRHQLAVHAALGDAVNERIALQADVRLGVEGLAGLTGSFYLKAEGVGLASRELPGIVQEVSLNSGVLDLDLWGEIETGRLRRVQGRTHIRNLDLVSSQSGDFALEHFSCLFDWARQAQGWDLDAEQIVIMSNHRLWPAGHLSLAWREDEVAGDSLQLGADYLRLREAVRSFALLPNLSPELRQMLVGLAPDGSLSRLRLSLLQQSGREAQWRVSGKLTQYRNEPWHSIPGLSGLNVNFFGNDQGGYLELNSQAFKTEMPQLFRQPLTANTLDGLFHWDFSPAMGVRLQTLAMRLANDHLQTLSRMNLLVPLDGQPPWIDMQTDFWDGDGKEKSRYFPVGIMHDKLVDWLDHALVSGHVKSGSMLLHGTLSDFPFKNQEGRFEVLFGIEGFILDYMPDWPRVDEVDAEVHFLNNSLAIEMFGGKLLGSELLHGETHIDQLDNAATVDISGELTGPADDLFRLMRETPLRKPLQPLSKALSGAGEIKTGVELHIPLKTSAQLQVKGRVEFQDTKLHITDQDLDITALHGTLNLDNQKIWGKGIRGRLLGQPVTLNVATLKEQGADTTRIASRLKLSSNWLQERFPGMLDLLDGTAVSDVSVSVPHQNKEVAVRLDIATELQGMAIEAPQPFGKQAGEKRGLEVAVELDQNVHDLFVNYAGQYQAQLRDKGDGHWFGDIRLGAGQLELPQKSVIRVRGTLESLDLVGWAGWFAQHAGSSSSGPGVELDLKIDQLSLAGLVCQEARFRIDRKEGGWRFDLESPQLQGQVRMPDNLVLSPVVAKLSHLRLSSASFKSMASDQPPDLSRHYDPWKWPAVDLSIDRLILDEKNLGSAVLRWHKAPHGLSISELGVTGDALQINGHGTWELIENAHKVEMNLQGHLANLGQLQQDHQFNLGITDAPVDFTADLKCSKPLPEVSLACLSGVVGLNMGAGEIKEVDPGVGRLVGLFGLHTLGKRLRLDFTDFFAAGLKFDSIKGNITLDKGNALTRNLTMHGPSTMLEFKGRTGLVAHDYDQTITVTPKVSSTLPVVGAIAVNPGVGLALAVVQQVLGKEVDKITQTQYKLSGSWDDPLIEKISKETGKAQDGDKAVRALVLPGEDGY